MVAVAVLGLAGTGAVAQGVSFSGSAGMGVVYEGSTKDSTGNTKMESKVIWDSDFDIAISASGTTDGGLTFGASTAIEAGQGGGDVVDSEVHIGGESWTIKIGSLDPASHMGRSLGDVGYNGLGVDDVAENIMYDHDGMPSTDPIGQGTDAQVEVSFNLGAASLAITAAQVGGKAAADTDDDGIVDTTENKIDTPAVKEDTEWAAGVGFEIGSTSLGIGIDSEKLYQASVSADLGAFGGKLFFSQQKTDGATDLGEEARSDTNTGTIVTNKKTGIGVEISVSAGENTTINAVYAQGKQSDIRTGDVNASADAEDAKVVSKTDKGFGVGVSHSLGGGATLQAGFAKVMKQTKASVGVTMSF